MDIFPLTVSVTQAARSAGIGRTSLYAAIATGRLKTRKFGRRTLIEFQALRDFVSSLPSSGSHDTQ